MFEGDFASYKFWKIKIEFEWSSPLIFLSALKVKTLEINRIFFVKFCPAASGESNNRKDKRLPAIIENSGEKM